MNIDTTTIGELEFKDVSSKWELANEGSQYAHHGEFGSFTVLDRMTGFGHRDVETGFRDKQGAFWLVNGGFSIRNHPELTINEAIQMVKNLATQHREVELGEN